MRTMPLLFALLFAANTARAQEPVEWLPDMVVDRAYLLDRSVTDTVVQGRLHLLLSNATPNVGPGDLYIYGVLPANEDGSQDVMQRVFMSDGTYYDRPAGRFVFHPEHDHIHLEGWAQYRLRTVTPEGGVGDIVAQGDKTSYCLRDSRVYDPRVPNFEYGVRYDSCEGLVQGISVGYEDIYTKNLPDQWIDITDVPPGTYWLESEVDPDNHVLEADEDNNVARVRVALDGAPSAPPRFDFIYALISLRQFILWLRYLRGA